MAYEKSELKKTVLEIKRQIFEALVARINDEEKGLNKFDSIAKKLMVFLTRHNPKITDVSRAKLLIRTLELLLPLDKNLDDKNLSEATTIVVTPEELKSLEATSTKKINVDKKNDDEI